MEDQQYQKAKKRVKQIREFHVHFGTWILTSIFLFGINFLTSPGFLWAFFPFLGWGIGVGTHAIEVFGLPGRGKDWEQREIEKEMKKLRDPEEEKGDDLVLPKLEKTKDPLYRDDELV